MASEVVAVGTATVEVGKLYWDKDLYPRVDVNPYNVSHLVEKIRAGVTLDHIVVEAKTLRIVDGVHRQHGYIRTGGEDTPVKVDAFKYKSTPALLRHSIQLNTRHGTNLSSQDTVRVIGLLDQAGFSVEESAQILSISPERFGELKMRLAWDAESPETKHVAIGKDTKSKPMATFNMKPVPLKWGTRQLAGEKLTKEQVEANDKYTGHEQIFSVNNVIRLIEGNLLDRKNARLVKRLKYLAALIKKL